MIARRTVVKGAAWTAPLSYDFIARDTFRATHFIVTATTTDCAGTRSFDSGVKTF